MEEERKRDLECLLCFGAGFLTALFVCLTIAIMDAKGFLDF